MIAEAERLAEIVALAEHRPLTGSIEDTEAVDLAVERGLVRKVYVGVYAMLGLSHLVLAGDEG